jgi:hypothetical protein
MGEEEVVLSPSHDAEHGSAEQLYSRTFWSGAMAAERRTLLQSLFLPLLYTSLLMWACLSLFWGSLTTNNHLTKLKATVVNREGESGVLGPAIVAAISNAHNSLDWQIVDGGHPDLAKRLVLNEDVWATVESVTPWPRRVCGLGQLTLVIVSANATSALNDSLANGNPTYNPTDAISLYYASARNQITVNSHVVPGILAIVNPMLSVVAVKHTSSFLQKNVKNERLLDTASRCPQCFANPFVLKSVDLAPFDAAVASGSTMVGMIFVSCLYSDSTDRVAVPALTFWVFPQILTFAFSIFQILRTNGLVVGAKLRLRSALIFRTIASLGAYFVLSLMYTLINRAFSVPMSGTFTECSGFMVYWMLNWCTMAAGT